METAIKDMPQFAKYKGALEHFVQQPDHDDIGFLANKHFYFGEKEQPEQDIFLKHKEPKDEKPVSFTDKLKAFGTFSLGALNTATVLKKNLKQ